MFWNIENNYYICINIKDMDDTQVINDYLENPEMDVNSLSDLISMAQDYQYQLLMSELQEEINS
jgi:hypothetical protein